MRPFSSSRVPAMSHPQDPFAVELTPDVVIRAYCAGIFPMSEDAEDDNIFWVSPEMRGVMPLDGFHMSKSLRKAIRQSPFTVKVDTDFGAVIEACASVGKDRNSTWINATIRKVYGQLFDYGLVHTVETWDGDELVGGLYGLAIGSAFFGESMFHRKTNASKMAMAHLVDRLNAGGFQLLDMQFITDHLASLGGIEIPREDYEERLKNALQSRGDWHALDKNRR
jgi:leucyl/phenylalanyl-tRNA--protein transferase